MSQIFTSEQVFATYENASSKFLTPFQRKTLLKHLQTNLSPEYQRRLEIMLLADMGKSQTQICQILGCSQQMARYWISRAEAGLAHKWQERSLGRPKTINDQYIHRLKELVSKNPRDCGYGFQSWTAQWLSKHLANEFGIEISDRHINRLLKNMGLSTKSKNTSEKITNKNQNSGITICDLQSNTENKLNLSLNLI